MLGRYRSMGASRGAPTIHCAQPSLRTREHQRKQRATRGAKILSIGALLLGSISAYADSASVINQINSNADLIAAQAQNNIAQQQQVLAQRLQALSAAMQAQLPNVPVQPSVPIQAPAQAVAKPVTTPTPVPPQTTVPQATSTPQPNVTALAPASQNNDSNNSNQWNYGF